MMTNEEHHSKLDEIIERLVKMEVTIQRHITEEQRDISELLEAWRSAKGAAKITKVVFAILIGAIATIATAYDWIHSHLTFTSK